MIAIIVMILKKIMTPAELCILFRSKLSKFSAKMAKLSIASLPRSVSSLKPERVTQYSPRYLLLIRCQIRFVGRFFRLSSLKRGCAPCIAPAFRFAQRHHHHHTHFQTGKLKTSRCISELANTTHYYVVWKCSTMLCCFSLVHRSLSRRYGKH